MEAVKRHMDRARLRFMKNTKAQGFTLIEALVSMTIFTLGFSGLYFFYGVSQQVIADSEKRMYINLMADRIIETIAAEGMRSVSDSLNPFITPSQYAGSLATCNFNSADSRQAWCLDLNSNIGALNPSSGLEIRQVDLVNDGTGLIINISLVTGGGSIGAFFTRKLRQL